MAVNPGVGGGSVDSAAGSEELGKEGLFGLLLESLVTGRIVAPLRNGELDEDLGERDVCGLGPSGLWSPGVNGDDTFTLLDADLDELRSNLGTGEFRAGILKLSAERGEPPKKKRYMI